MATHAFQLPHRSSRAQARSLSRRRKRRRDSSDVNDTYDELQEDVDELRQLSPSSSLAGVTGLTANNAEQYRTAGLDPRQDLPSHPFPHAADGPRKSRGRPKVQPGASDPLSREDEAVRRRAEQATSLRQHHLSVLTTIMHRCLLDGDYDRAGKAWALLIRSSPPLDVRRHDRWGIGAEILMRRVDPHPEDNEDHDSDNDDQEESVGPNDSNKLERPFLPNTSYHEEGLRAARSYYDMLIRRFPAHLATKAARGMPNASDFNPAMLNVWLYQIAFTRKKVLRQLDEEARSDESTASDHTADDRATRNDRNETTSARLERLRINELREAESINAKLNELLASPLYDQDRELQRLSSMIQVWLDDLRNGEDNQDPSDVSPRAAR